jgi:hypothetical protein
MHWSVPKMWTEDCWIIGGGPSMLQQFDVPSDVIQKVEKGELPFSTYSDYLTPLHSKNVIGTNISFMLGEWISVLYFCDARFYRTHFDQISAFRNLKVTCVNHLDRELLPYSTNVKRLKRDYKPGLSNRPEFICWNNNSGGAAINFATLAGAKRILLLGFDMKAQDKKTHWHNAYKTPTLNATFRNFLKRYPVIADDARRIGVEILNVNPDSALDAFPKVSLKDVL